MFQRSKTGYSSSVQNVLWLMSSNVDIAGGLLAPRNLFYPNLRVTKVSFIGKLKTTAQMLALIGLLSGLESFMGWPLYWVTLGYILLYVATVLSLWSMLIYTRAAWPEIVKR